METPDLFEDPLSEYCRSPSPAASNASSVPRPGLATKRRILISPQSMVPDFSNRREKEDISEVIASKFKRTKPKQTPDTKFVRQNIKKWKVDIRTRRSSEGSSELSCPQHPPLLDTPRKRSYSSSRRESDTTSSFSSRRQSDTTSGQESSLSRGLSEDDLQKLNKITRLFEAFKNPVEVVAGRRADVAKRMQERGGNVPLSSLLSEQVYYVTRAICSHVTRVICYYLKRTVFVTFPLTV